jgi:2-aminoethylphosphonate-pyruvate transaminase
MNKPETAVILAAGMGSRLGQVFSGKPKGLLEIGGMSLVGRSMHILKNSGIDRIIIGTGHHASAYESLAKEHGAVCVFNGRFSETGSMCTLWNLRAHVGEPFLLLESDLLYHPSAIRMLLEDEREDVILASGPTHSGDEVFIGCSREGLLINMSKDRSVISNPDTELVGISKISTRLFKKMCEVFEKSITERPRLEYEEALVAAAKTLPIHIRKAEELVWCEIDDPAHLKRATEIIWPAIRKDFL